jgi:hypothetical protein
MEPYDEEKVNIVKSPDSNARNNTKLVTPTKKITNSEIPHNKIIRRKFETKKQVDDVYDEKACLKGHTLYSLRKSNLLNYNQFMDMGIGNYEEEEPVTTPERGINNPLLNIPDIN